MKKRKCWKIWLTAISVAVLVAGMTGVVFALLPGDVDGNGRVDIFDALVLAEYDAKLRDSLPVEAFLSEGREYFYESDFAKTPSLRATQGNIIVIVLEPPNAEADENDTYIAGADRIPLYFPQDVTREFKSVHKEGDLFSVRLLDASGNEVLSLDRNTPSKTVNVSAGNYTLELHHGGGKEGYYTLFVRPGSGKKRQDSIFDIDIGEYCSWCSLSGFQMPDIPDFESDLSNADLSGANLDFANLSGADLSGADLSEATLYEANLSGANLSNANLSEAYLLEADLSGADLSGADMSNADLSGANLSGANLSGANLSYADMNSVNLSNANLTGAILSNANLTKANLSNANLTDAILTKADLNNATWTDGRTCAACSLGQCD